MSATQTLKSLPWRAIKQAFHAIRQANFAHDAPSVPGVIVSNDRSQTTPLPDRIDTVLGEVYFEPDEFSYYYHGEVVNLRRVVHDASRVDDLTWWQTHVRGFPVPGGLRLISHYEPAPLAHPTAHLSDEYVDWAEGMDRLRSVLDEIGESYVPTNKAP